MQHKFAGKIIKIFLLMVAVSFMMSGISFAVKSDSTKPVNINQATVKELSALPGIGKKRAEAIIAYREQKGKFTSVEDIKKVEGIGKNTFEKVKDNVVME